MAHNQQTSLDRLDRPAEEQPWDLALISWNNAPNFPLYPLYHRFALDGERDWVLEPPELRRLYAQALRTVDRQEQAALIRQMERHIHDQAFFLFLYNPITLYAANKAVAFVPYVNGGLQLVETSVTAQHWSVRKQKAAVHE